MSADVWSRLLVKMGVKYRTERQWYWVRNTLLHFPAGIVIGISTWLLSLLLGTFMWVLIAIVLAAGLIFMESRDLNQSPLKMLTDWMFWMIGYFLMMWSLI